MFPFTKYVIRNVGIATKKTADPAQTPLIWKVVV